MRTLIIRLFLIVSVSCISFSSANAAPLGVGGTAADWELQAKDGSSLNYYVDSEDKVSVIIF